MYNSKNYSEKLMKTYSFYGFLQLHFNFNGHAGYERYFNSEYQRITYKQKTNKNSPSITVSIVKSLPTANKEDIVQTSRYKKLFTFKFLIRNIDSNEVEIFFENHPVDKIYMNAIAVFLQAQVLEPVMYLKFLESDVLLMHAGGVAKNGHGYLLPAHGGTGKTTFSIALLNSGFKLLGDDLLIVDIKNHKVYPYPRPLHLFAYNINNLNGARVPLKYKVAIYSKKRLSCVLERVLKTEFLISTRVHADELFSGTLFGQACPYKSIFFLKKGGDASEKVAVDKKSIDKIVKEIMISEDLNDSLYSLLKNQKEITHVKELEFKVIRSLLSQFNNINYVNTRKLNLNNLDQFIKNNF